MKLIKLSFLIVFLAFSTFNGEAQDSNKSDASDLVSENIEVYYFHYTMRCVTCNAIEDETKMLTR